MEIINGIDQDDTGGDCTDIDNSTIDSSIIGGTTPAAGSFTVLKASTDPVSADGVGDQGFNDGRYCLESNNLSDVGNAATSFSNIKQTATDSTTGVSELSTDIEVVTGTATDRVVTPANVTAKMAAPGAIGGTTPASGAFTTLDATGQLHTTSGIKLAGLTENLNNTRVVLTDASGNLDYRSLENPVSLLDAPFGQYVLYTPTFNNLLYSAEKRFTVTQTGFSTFDASGLFNSNYDDNLATITTDDTECTININLIDKSEFSANGLTYSYGWIYVYFNYYYYTNSVKARLKTKNGGATFEWRSYATGTNISSNSIYQVMKIPLSGNYKCSDIEIVITSDTVNGSGTKQVQISEIEFVLSRSVLEYARPVVSKILDNSLFGDTKWKNSSNVTKAQVTPSTGNAQFLGGIDITGKLDVDNDTIRLRTVKTPATAGADGDQGDIAWDANYLYVCTATNTWKRSGLSTW